MAMAAENERQHAPASPGEAAEDKEQAVSIQTRVSCHVTNATQSPKPVETVRDDVMALDSNEKNEVVEHDLNVTEDDLLEAQEIAKTLSLDDVRQVSSPSHINTRQNSCSTTSR